MNAQKEDQKHLLRETENTMKFGLFSMMQVRRVPSHGRPPNPRRADILVVVTVDLQLSIVSYVIRLNEYYVDWQERLRTMSLAQGGYILASVVGFSILLIFLDHRKRRATCTR